MSERVATWIDAYRKAWLSNAESDIRALFTDDALYEHRANDADALHGADAIVADWLRRADGPHDTTWAWHPVVEQDDVAVVQGVTVYDAPTMQTTVDNLWIVTFTSDGRASRFTEWYMERKKDT